MFIIALVLFLVVGIIFTVVVSGGNLGDISWLIDYPSLVSLLIFSVPFLIISGLGKDFANSFKIVFGKQDFSISELKKSSLAVSFFIKLLFAAAILTTAINLIALFFFCEYTESFAPNIAVSIIIFLYTIMFTLFLMPIKAKIDKKIIEFLAQD